MLKECDARLLPQAMAEEQRRINGSRQYGSSDKLRHVVNGDELRRADLIMNLKACVAGFHHHVVVRNLQFINALDVDVETASAQGCDGAVQFVIARIRREVIEREVG